MLPTISIITDKDGKYERVCCSYPFGFPENPGILSKSGKLVYFATGDICKDYLDCIIFAKKLHDAGLPVMRSSSVDHWTMDNEEYGWGVLEVADGMFLETIIRL